jgi:cyanophycinase
MAHVHRGPLIIIGGHEDREGEKVILSEVARHVARGKLVVTTVASSAPEGQFEEYRRIFRDLGVHQVAELPIADRSEAKDDKTVEILDGATGVFFAGGDQLKITSQIGDTKTFRRIQEIHQEGGVIAGTSAGASVLCETMLVSGNSDESPKIGDLVRMAPGLGLVSGIIIDQHFAERGRLGRLTGAVAENPKELGIGIDEDTAVIIQGQNLKVLGNGSVYILDGVDISWSNVSEAEAGHNLSVHDVRLHILATGDRFHLRERRPIRAKQSG